MTNGPPVNIPELIKFVMCINCFWIGGSSKGLLSKKNVDCNDEKCLNCLTKTTESGGP